MAQYKTPGVYVEEKSMLPPSVAGVATAVPAFIGFTQKKSSRSIQPITSLLEYQTIFGEGKAITYDNGTVKGPEYALFDSIRLFYDNGGGACYVVSVGTYEDSVTAEKYKAAISLLEQQTDVTILVFPDAATLFTDSSDLASVQMAALSHCQTLGGRFAILDVMMPEKIKVEEPAEAQSAEGEGEGQGQSTRSTRGTSNKQPKLVDATLTDHVRLFRDGVTNNLCYGAAYYPFIKTTYAKDIPFDVVYKALPADIKTAAENADVVKAVNEILALDSSTEANADYKKLRIKAIIPQIPGYAETLAALQDKASIIPPSGAIAGIYAATDARVGVWQAPANVGIASVKDLTTMMSDTQQGNLNVDPETAKSINAIRYFKGKGILVWGARTLDGGSNEWRYVPVRRLFSYVEQSVKLSTAWAVFQPNDANTWIKIKCQITNFLSTLWRDGAMAGSSPDEAFFVEVGKGVTMTEDDINNGYLRVRIGLAAVRPAEFIVLEFSHKVNE
jgi:phage tail sheath protein FI